VLTVVIARSASDVSPIVPASEQGERKTGTTLQLYAITIAKRETS
jgi:hypothetical protein